MVFPSFQHGMRYCNQYQYQYHFFVCGVELKGQTRNCLKVLQEFLDFGLPNRIVNMPLQGSEMFRFSSSCSSTLWLSTSPLDEGHEYPKNIHSRYSRYFHIFSEDFCQIAVSSAHFLIIFPFFQRGVEGSGAATRCPCRGGALSGYGIWLDGIWWIWHVVFVVGTLW